MTNSTTGAGTGERGTPIPPPATPGGGGGPGRTIAVVVFVIFIVVGGVLLWTQSIRPAMRARAAAASWNKVPCTIVSSTVAEHPGSGDEQPTYSVDVRYHYFVGGRRYQSNRYDFFPGFTGGREEKHAIARRYPRGSTTICYVNPADPADAVLEPSLGNRRWLLAFPLIFVLFGLAGLSITRRGARRAAAAAASGSSLAGPALASPNSETLTLRLSERPITQFISFTIFALMFDAALVLVVREMARGRVSGWVCASLFLILWAAVCLGLTGAAIHAGLALFNPRATVTLARGAVPPGGAADLQWTFDGRYDRIRRLTLRLEGRERATYRQGTDTLTDTNAFATLPLFGTDRNDRVARGKCALHVPAGAMHTFRARHNEIRWFLVVHGEIPRWPDVKSEFEIEVPPPAIRPAVPVETPPAVNRAIPDSSVAIRTTDGRTSFSPGEPIAGAVSWSLPAIPKQLEVRLYWFTRGKGTPDVQIVERVVIDGPPIQGVHPFTFHAPNGPYSFSGKLISLMWGLEVVAEPKDRSERIEIVCAPGGREIVPDPAAFGVAPEVARIVIGR